MSLDGVSVTDPLRSVIFGENDPRVRAIWRVLLAMPVLWVLTGAILAGGLQTAIGAIPSGQSAGSGLAQSLLHGGFFLIALVIWARYLDREPLSNYGVSVSSGWTRDFLVGIVAVFIGFTVWAWFSSLLGEKSVQLSVSQPGDSVLFWLVIPMVALVLHAAVQQVVFFRIILKTAAEGLHSRGMNASRAAVTAIPVAVLFFILMHGSTTPLRVLDLAVVGGIFGLLYLHTGELGLGIGAHLGALYFGTLSAGVFRVTGSLSGMLGVIDQYGFPKMVVSYLVVVVWLILRRGEIPRQYSIARRNGR